MLWSVLSHSPIVNYFGRKCHILMKRILNFSVTAVAHLNIVMMHALRIEKTLPGLSLTNGKRFTINSLLLATLIVHVLALVQIPATTTGTQLQILMLCEDLELVMLPRPKD